MVISFESSWYTLLNYFKVKVGPTTAAALSKTMIETAVSLGSFCKIIFPIKDVSIVEE